MDHLKKQEILIEEIMIRHNLDYLDALEIARLVMKTDGESKVYKPGTREFHL